MADEINTSPKGAENFVAGQGTVGKTTDNAPLYAGNHFDDYSEKYADSPAASVTDTESPEAQKQIVDAMLTTLQQKFTREEAVATFDSFNASWNTLSAESRKSLLSQAARLNLTLNQELVLFSVLEQEDRYKYVNDKMSAQLSRQASNTVKWS